MKKPAFFLFCFFIVHTVFAQDNDGPNSIVIRKIDPNGIIVTHSEVDEQRIQRGFSQYKILIDVIGWSRTGLFAYRTKFYHHSARPGSGYDLIIFNSITDSIIDGDEIYTSTADYNRPSDKLVAETKSRWNGLLHTYGIIGQIKNPIEEIKEGGYQTFEGKSFECWLERESVIYSWGTSEYARLMAGINGKQKKVSSRGIYDFNSIYGDKIIGYYKSPYENRIVILTLRMVWGHEDTVKTVFYGCHMDAGFE